METEQELLIRLSKKFDIPPPQQSPREVFQLLSTFWHHFALHKRKCDRTGRSIISVFDEHCPYPVWHREEWIKHADPPQANYDPTLPFFEQLWELFQTCPIAHNVGAGNENCEYSDDWWYSKNCYLCHSGVDCEDAYYCYRTVNLKDCQYCVFSFDSERCTDLINCHNCYASTYALNSRNCRDSAFLFDCRNCSHCLFSWNLRNKQYCIFNQQLSKEEYEKERAKYDFSSRQQYQQAKQSFFDMIKTKAWWRNVYQEQCENCSGDIIDKCKNCHNCFLYSESEDCINSMRGGWNKDTLNTVCAFRSELTYLSVLPQDQCYDIRFCYNVIQCKSMEYSAHCFNSKDCFGCCGLVNKRYCIFNKEYSPQEYQEKVKEIKKQLQQEGIYGQFFPFHFAANSYDESLSGFYWPLTREEQEQQGYRVKQAEEQRTESHQSTHIIPDLPREANPEITEQVFWDEKANKPFQITPFDLKFCKNNNVPLPNSYYIRRIKENFSMIFFSGEMRQTSCAISGKPILTGLPQQLDGRIISIEEYHKKIG